MKYLSVFVLLFGSLSLYSQDFSRVFIGPQAYSYHLHIDNGTATGATATANPYEGWLAGFILGYEYKRPNHLYAVLQSSYALGSTHRTDQGTGNNNRYIHDFLLEDRFGFNWSCCTGLHLIPYTGNAFRWNAQYRNPGILKGLKYDYFKISIPLGFLIEYKPHRTVQVGLDFEWLPDVLSMVSLSTLNGSYWELNRLNNYIVQLPCLFSSCNRYEIGLTPFWMHFEDGSSVAVTDAGIALNLDKQITNNWGGRLFFGIRF